MNNKEFEDFFKDLDPNETPAPKETEEPDEDLVFASFFEDATSKNKPKASAKIQATPLLEDDIFAPPPPTEDEAEEEISVPVKEEPVKEIPKKEPEKKKTEKSSEAAKRKKKNIYITAYNWLITVMWVSGVLAVSVLLATFALSSINDLVGFSKESREIEIVIPENSTLGEIADILEEKGVIDEPFTFEVYAMIKEMEGRLAPGKYTLNSNLGYDQIFQALKIRENAREVVSVTLIEGMTITEIAKILEEKNVCKADEFVAALDDLTFDYEFETMMGTDELIYHHWEGYLFPDTYEFYTNSTPKSVMSRFVANFNNKISGYYVRMQELGLSLHETITLASVIQSEAGKKADMANVSSAFHNRMKKGSGLPNLQSDVTYFYYRDEIEPFVEDQELSDKYHESYDTYFKKGLPIGPICNPGIGAIEAALYPSDTNYLYFVTDKEGNFYYASTYAEHEKNVQKAGLGQ